MNITIQVNGKEHTHDVEPRMLLVDFLRDLCGLTGTHMGCDTSQCGCCTVLLNNNAVKSCTHLAVQANGQEVLTIEGLGAKGLHAVQKAFTQCHALQCGFCTPGMVMSAVDLVQKNPQGLSQDEIRHGLEGNLCRCTGYHNIVKAIDAAQGLMHAKAAE